MLSHQQHNAPTGGSITMIKPVLPKSLQKKQAAEMAAAVNATPLLLPPTSHHGAAAAPTPKGGNNNNVGDGDSFKTYQNLFVACLPRSLTDKDLLGLFASFNPSHAAVMMDVATGRSKGYGFVTFATEAEGRAAATALGGTPAKLGRCTFTMHISPSKHNGTTVLNESTFVYLRNVPAELRVEDVRDLLARCGTLVWLQTRPDEEHQGLQLVMAEYATLEEAARAIRDVHRSVPFPRLSKLPIMAKYADPGAVVLQRRARVPAYSTPSLNIPEASYTSSTSACGVSSTDSDAEHHSGDERSDTPIPVVGAHHHFHHSTGCFAYRNDPYSLAGFVLLA